LCIPEGLDTDQIPDFDPANPPDSQGCFNLFDNPWAALFSRSEAHGVQDPTDGTIPAFADADSLQWILKISPGGIYQFDGPDGNPIKLKIVGTLPGSIFASQLLISEPNLKKIYPKLNGHNRFLFAPSVAPVGAQAFSPRQAATAAPPWDNGPTKNAVAPVGAKAVSPEEQMQLLADTLRTALADQGIEVHTTREILNRYISVQNVYMSIFLSLGGLGLLLGTAGLIAVIARSVLERRGELALMAAAGFKRSTLVRLITIEHIALLTAGLLSGTTAALLAVAPILTSGHADVQWLQLAITLIAVAIVGVLVCIITARTAIDRNPIRALREE